MSNCSCFSEEGQSYWKRVATKCEKKVRLLTAKRSELKRRLEVMRLQMPAYFCYNLMRIPPGAEGHINNIIAQLQAPLQTPSRFSYKTNCCSNDSCGLNVPLYNPDNRWRKSKSKVREPSTALLDRECKCENCANNVLKRLQAERDEDLENAEFEKKCRKPSIKRICHCDICRLMIPEKPFVKPKLVKREVIAVEKKIECFCAKDADIEIQMPDKDKSVCECSVCAEEVIKRIQSSDTKFESVACGCEAPVATITIPEAVEIPICHCNSCKEELNKRLGFNEEKVEKTDEKCYCNSEGKPDWLCECVTCTAGLQRTVTVPCTCNADNGDLPLCGCDTCSRGIKIISIDDVKNCICKCEICNEVRLKREKEQEIEEVSKEDDIPCICDCTICNTRRGQLAGATVDSNTPISKEDATCMSNYKPSELRFSDESLCACETSSESRIESPIQCFCSSHSTSTCTCKSSPEKSPVIFTDTEEEETEKNQISIESGLPCKCARNLKAKSTSPGSSLSCSCSKFSSREGSIPEEPTEERFFGEKPTEIEKPLAVKELAATAKKLAAMQELIEVEKPTAIGVPTKEKFFGGKATVTDTPFAVKELTATGKKLAAIQGPIEIEKPTAIGVRTKEKFFGGKATETETLLAVKELTAIEVQEPIEIEKSTAIKVSTTAEELTFLAEPTASEKLSLERSSDSPEKLLPSSLPTSNVEGAIFPPIDVIEIHAKPSRPKGSPVEKPTAFEKLSLERSSDRPEKPLPSSQPTFIVKEAISPPIDVIDLHAKPSRQKGSPAEKTAAFEKLSLERSSDRPEKPLASSLPTFIVKEAMSPPIDVIDLHAKPSRPKGSPVGKPAAFEKLSLERSSDSSEKLLPSSLPIVEEAISPPIDVINLHAKPSRPKGSPVEEPTASEALSLERSSDSSEKLLPSSLPTLIVKKDISPPTDVIRLHAQSSHLKGSPVEEYERKIREKWIKETTYICSCVEEMEYDDPGNRPENCATNAEECCCLRISVDKFSKLDTEIYQKKHSVTQTNHNWEWRDIDG